MLILYETPAGYSVFKVNDKKKLASVDADDIYEKFFSDAKSASKMLSLVSFQPFADTADAVAAATACQEGTVNKTLKKFLLKKVFHSDKHVRELAVADKTLGGNLKDAVSDLKIIHDTKTQELFRGIRCHVDELLKDSGLSAVDLNKMQLGLSHSLGRYKLKFSADKVDTMIIQAVGLLDELDKEINTYAMRVKEWYGWHFPELQALLSDNATYSKLVVSIGYRQHYQEHSDVIDEILGPEGEATAAAVKEAAEVSMGTDITDLDLLNIRTLAENVLSLSEYRIQLFEYLKNRMVGIAPNLTILVGELVGARLISHAGSLLNLAKQPASTIQILGAEKALFRALKTKSNTPKYGLIYHASLIGQAPPKHKGKISRILAAKAALSVRVDALSDDVDMDDNGENNITTSTTVGYEGRAKVEARLRQLETGGAYTLVKTSGASNSVSNTQSTSANLTSQKTARYDPVAAVAATKTSTTRVKTNEGMVQLTASTTQKSPSSENNNRDTDSDNDKKSKKIKKEKKDKKKKDSNSTETHTKKRHHAEIDDKDDGSTSEEKSKKVKQVDNMNDESNDLTPNLNDSSHGKKKKEKKDKKEKKEKKKKE